MVIYRTEALLCLLENEGLEPSPGFANQIWLANQKNIGSAIAVINNQLASNGMDTFSADFLGPFINEYKVSPKCPNPSEISLDEGSEALNVVLSYRKKYAMYVTEEHKDDRAPVVAVGDNINKGVDHSFASVADPPRPIGLGVVLPLKKAKDRDDDSRSAQIRRDEKLQQELEAIELLTQIKIIGSKYSSKVNAIALKMMASFEGLVLTPIGAITRPTAVQVNKPTESEQKGKKKCNPTPSNPAKKTPEYKILRDRRLELVSQINVTGNNENMPELIVELRHIEAQMKLLSKPQ